MHLKTPNAIAATLLSVLLLSGCSSPTPSPSMSRTPSANSSSMPDTGVIKGNMAIPTGQYITDAAGRYETVQLAPQANVLDPKFLAQEDTKTKTMYTKAQVSSGVKFAFGFAVSEGLDSIALDGNERGWAIWQREVAPKYVYAATRADILKAVGSPESHVDRSLLIYNDQDNVFPTLLREGKPRFTEIAYEPKSAVISAGKDGNIKFLSVTAAINAKARATNAEIKKAALLLNKQSGATGAQFDKAYPKYKNPKGINTITLRYAFAYYLVQDEDGNWKIGGDQVKPNYDIFGRDLSTATATK